MPKRVKFVGGRIVKTGIAVFVTAFICHILNWPVMFAVITAIVTIEPTVADSIKKAFVRLPASAIGAAFAILFTFLFGDSPYSYAFVSLSTIIACHKLKLHDGTLVATLTGVAMISTVHDEYFSSFFIRLGSTSTGIIISALVNFFVMPPNYSKSITNKIHDLLDKSGDIFDSRCLELLNIQPLSKDLRGNFQALVKDVDQTETLCTYQKDEWKYHRISRKEIRDFHYKCKKLTTLRQIIYHLGNLIYLPSVHIELSEEKKRMIVESVKSIKGIFHSKNFHIPDSHHQQMNRLREWFSKQQHTLYLEDEYHQHLSTETLILYELLAIHDLVEELNNIQSLEIRHQLLLEKNKGHGV
ncbi:aromatic acid exporter family protein [Bacillus salitolerans]|uniref:Aromatic acid exporter family protein n=1 Tax=Bacillus salitolerans TaxID=1437434 RepID=A0ABW4LPB6_9BACI